MAVNSGWQPPSQAGRFFATLAAIVIVAWGYMTIPSGCETEGAARSRSSLPGSPLEKNSTGSTAATTSASVGVAKDFVEKPKTPPPLERPLPPTDQPNIRVRVAAVRDEPCS